MTYYVRIPNVNGRKNLALLSEIFNEVGLLDVEYHSGGWVDECLFTIEPHLKFENEHEATLYILKYGGKIEDDLPIREIN